MKTSLLLLQSYQQPKRMQIHQALHYLNKITGEMTTDDLLANILYLEVGLDSSFEVAFKF